MNDTGKGRRRPFIAALLGRALVVSAAGGYVAVFGWKPPAALGSASTDETSAPTHVPDDGEDENRVLTIKVVRPKLNRSQLVRSVTQPAYVQPYRRANLMTPAAGMGKA